MNKTVLENYSLIESFVTDSYIEKPDRRIQESEYDIQGYSTDFQRLLSSDTYLNSRNILPPKEVKYVINLNTRSSSSTMNKSYSHDNFNYYNTILNIIKNDTFEDGEISKSQLFIENLKSAHDYNNVVTSLIGIYNNAVKSEESEQIFIGLLTMFASKPFTDLRDSNKETVLDIVSSLLENENVYLRDKTVQVFEKWNLRRFIPLLSEHKENVKWLKNYIDEVICYLKEGGIH